MTEFYTAACAALVLAAPTVALADDAMMAGGHTDLMCKSTASMMHDEKIVGPEATILTYLSGRQVYPPNVLLLPHSDGPKFPRAWFPMGTGRQMFDEYDLPIQTLVRAGKISQGRSVGKGVAGYQLAELTVAR